MLTPGVSVSRSSNLRPRIGVVLTAVSLIVVLASVFTVSTVGVVVTVTFSATSEIFSENGIVCVCPTVRAVLGSSVVAKPGLATVTE